jgi:predicted transcriptional regulator
VSRGRDESGKYTAQTGSEQVLQVLREHPDPVVTATEIAEHLDVSAETARRYLSDLHENGKVRRKQVGARAVVWWLSDETDAPATPLTGLVGMLDEDAVEQAERRSREWRERFDEEMG